MRPPSQLLPALRPLHDPSSCSPSSSATRTCPPGRCVPGWCCKHFGFAFQEIKLPLDTPEFHAHIVSTRRRRVPVLIDGDAAHLGLAGDRRVPQRESAGPRLARRSAARAHARAVSAEMHSGFAALRTHWPMKATGSNPTCSCRRQGQADVARVAASGRTAARNTRAWALAVRRVLDRRCDVRTGRAALPSLRREVVDRVRRRPTTQQLAPGPAPAGVDRSDAEAEVASDCRRRSQPT